MTKKSAWNKVGKRQNKNGEVEKMARKDDILSIYTKEVEQIKADGLFKGEAPFVSPQGAKVVMEDGRELLNMCANNYLGLGDNQRMIDAVNAGALTIEKLEAMTCVCSVGLDMIAIPGKTTASTISGIIADEMAIGMVNQKTTAVRLIPVIGKKVGDTVEFGGLLGYAPVMPVNSFDCSAFINRGGRIPAPIHSFKN